MKKLPNKKANNVKCMVTALRKEIKAWERFNRKYSWQGNGPYLNGIIYGLQIAVEIVREGKYR